MKLILRDYLASLNERPELKNLLEDLLPYMGYRIERPDFRGVVQHGVDIIATKSCSNGQRELFLFVLKQGDITNSNFDTKPQDLRPTLNNIIDVPYKDVTKKDFKKISRKTVVVVQNGFLHSNLQDRLNGIVRQFKRKKYDFDRWELPKLTDNVADYLLTDRVFDKKIQSDLRLTLSFLEDQDYDLRHFKRIFDKSLAELIRNNSKGFERFIYQVRLILLVLSAHSEKNNLSLKHLENACEYTLLKTYHWLHRQRKSKEKKWIDLFVKLWHLYCEIEIKITRKIKRLVEVEEGLAFSGSQESVEYPLRAFDLIGRLGYQILFWSQFYRQDTNPEVKSILQELYITLRNTVRNLSAIDLRT